MNSTPHALNFFLLLMVPLVPTMVVNMDKIIKKIHFFKVLIDILIPKNYQLSPTKLKL